MKIAGIVSNSLQDGDGVRAVIFTQGCSLHCPGCHNKHTWDFNDGCEMTDEEIISFVQKNNITKKVTISGGNPLEQGDKLLSLLKKLKALDYNIWVYSGFKFDYIKKVYQKYLKYIDVIVDGPYIDSMKDKTLKYIGSYNQRIIYLEDGIPHRIITRMNDYTW